ncbi:MAG TPA: HAD family hydrolase [Rhodoglobus sp.]|nr:HAD family hydrolase [Rhodoglobus sp.]
MSTFVLWDIDGTLIENSPHSSDLYLDAIEHVTGVRPSADLPDREGMNDAQVVLAFLRADGLEETRLSEVLFDLDVLSREQHERGWDREACAGAESALTAVRERGWTNALLTGNGPDRARFKLLSAGYDPESFDWSHSYFGHESPTRHHVTAGAREPLTDHTVFVVGDAPNDARAADAAGLPFIAVATGMYSAEVLRNTSAVLVLDDLERGLDTLLATIADATGEAAPVAEPDDAIDEAAPTEAEPAEAADGPQADADIPLADVPQSDIAQAQGDADPEPISAPRVHDAVVDDAQPPTLAIVPPIDDAGLPEPLEGPDIELPVHDDGERADTGEVDAFHRS